MEALNRQLIRASKYITEANEDRITNLFLGAAFTLLCFRSHSEEKELEQLETQKAALLENHKSLKKFMWDSKQKLYAEAVNRPFSVPLQTIKAIYGEANPNAGNARKQDAKLPASKISI